MSTQSLRILVVLPFYGGSLPIGKYCIQALENLGHHVQCFNAPLFYSAFDGLKSLHIASDRLEQLEGSFLQVISQAIMAQVESFSPHMVLSMAQAPVSRQLLMRLRKMGIPTAMWFVEDYRIFTYWRAFAPLYDAFAVIQKEAFLQELQNVGQKNALYLPMAALPSFHQAQELLPLEQKKYGADIAFLGAGYPNRRKAFHAFVHKNFKIWGTEWEGDSLLKDCVQEQGARISPEDARKIYSATKVNINLHSSVQADELVPRGDFVNPRTFELAAMGVFQLVDKRHLMAELFPEDMLVTFTSAEQMLQLTEYYLKHEEERKVKAKAAQEHVLEYHSYERRMQSLLAYMTTICGPWKETAIVPLPENLSQEMQDELKTLLAQLPKASASSFDDVLAFVRKQTGSLSPLETSLLFMDAWREQYKK